MASKEVQIRAKRSKSSVIPEFIRDEAILRISSVYKFGSPLRGLNDEEEKQFLPLITPLDPAAKTWRQDANRWWSELTIKVPTDGIELETGVDEAGHPLNVLDYIKYRFALAHPLVAPSLEELADKGTYRFFINDPEVTEAKKHTSVELKAQAYAVFSKIKATKAGSLSFGRILRLNGLNPDRMTEAAIETASANFLEATPAKFIRFAESKDLADTALIEELVDQQVLRKLGTIYQFGDVRIGDSLDEAVAYIGSAKNSKNLVTMLARLQEKRKSLGLKSDDLKERLGIKEEVLEPAE